LTKTLLPAFFFLTIKGRSYANSSSFSHACFACQFPESNLACHSSCTNQEVKHEPLVTAKEVKPTVKEVQESRAERRGIESVEAEKKSGYA
jgi:hypothetical protein